MHDTVVARLEALQREYDTGQTMLAELDAKELDLRQTLLRIAGRDPSSRGAAGR